MFPISKNLGTRGPNFPYWVQNGEFKFGKPHSCFPLKMLAFSDISNCWAWNGNYHAIKEAKVHVRPCIVQSCLLTGFTLKLRMENRWWVVCFSSPSSRMRNWDGNGDEEYTVGVVLRALRSALTAKAMDQWRRLKIKYSKWEPFH